MFSPLAKNTYREITRSPGRFLAIIAIIVLGSGFFVGLRVSEKAMTATANTYLDDTRFYDFSVATTLGLTEEDVEAMRESPEILDAEGSFETDALVNFGEDVDLVYSFYSLPERINTPELLEGRLPESAGECLADSWSGLEPGDKIYISENNAEDDLELFTRRELTVTGVVTSPLYLNFERGSTALGSGSVSSFCYVLPEVFDADYFTTVYIRCEDMPEGYTAGYDDRSEALEDVLTAIADARADARYTTVVSDAQRELDDGWAEYNDGLEEYRSKRADAEKELEDAATELEDAAAKLEDGKREIEDGKRELDDGKKELRDNEKTLSDAKAALDSARVELEDAKKQIDDGEAEYANGVTELEDRRAQGQEELDSAKAELDDALAALNEGEEDYARGQREYNDGWAQYNAGAAELEGYRKQLAEGEAEYEANLAYYQQQKKLFDDGKAELAANAQRIEDAREPVKNSRQLFDLLMSAIMSGVNGDPSGKYSFASADELLAALPEDSELADTVTGILSFYQSMGAPTDSADLLEKYATLTNAEAEIKRYDDAVAALPENERLLAEFEAGLQTGRATLDGYQRQIQSGEAELSAAYSQLYDAAAQLRDARKELDDGWAEYNEGLAEYEDGVNEFNTAIADAEAQLSDAADALEDAKRQYGEGLAEYEDGLEEYNDGLKKYNDGKRKISDAEVELADAEREYADGLKEYEDGLKEYEDAKAEAEREFADAEAELSDARAELMDAEQEIADIAYPDAYLLGRWANVGYACFESDASIVRSISSVFPLFFFLVAALICITTVSRMVEEQRSQLGVLMALGDSRLAVMGKFLVYAGSATVIGCVSGLLLGSRVIPLVVWQAYKIMYSFSDRIEFYYDLRLSTVTFIMYLAAMLLVTWLSCRKALGDVPANVIRPKAPKAGKRVILERVPFIWNRLSFLWKVTVRNIFRYKLRVMMMILGIAGCTALMITGMGINDSIKNVVDYQFTEISRYDFTVTFSGDMDQAAREEFMSDASGLAEDSLFLHQSSFTATANRVEKSVYLNAVDAERAGDVGEFIDFHSGSRPLPFPGKGEALINTGLAKALGVKAGDTVELRDEGGAELTLTVSGVYDNYIYNNVYISSETYAGAVGAEPEINYALILKNASVTTGDALAAILRMDGVLTASASQELRDRIGSMMESLIYIVLLTIVCAAALAFVVIYNLTNINIQERLREIATVKVLGFYDGESALYVLRENLLLTLLGAAAGIPLGLALNAFVMSEIKIDLIHFTPRVLPMSYVYSVALTIIFSMMVDVLMFRRLKKINPAEALKAAE